VRLEKSRLSVQDSIDVEEDNRVISSEEVLDVFDFRIGTSRSTRAASDAAFEAHGSSLQDTLSAQHSVEPKNFIVKEADGIAGDAGNSVNDKLAL